MTAESEQFADGEGFRDLLRRFENEDLSKIPLRGLVDTIVNLEKVRSTSLHPIERLTGGPSPEYLVHARILDKTLAKLYQEVDRRERGF